MNESKKFLRALRFVNRFDTACNYALLKLFPISKNHNEVLVNSYAALEYARESLKSEKQALIELRRLMTQKDAKSLTYLLNSIQANQRERHARMCEIMEGKVR